jgi:hypothetical protein
MEKEQPVSDEELAIQHKEKSIEELLEEETTDDKEEKEVDEEAPAVPLEELVQREKPKNQEQQEEYVIAKESGPTEAYKSNEQDNIYKPNMPHQEYKEQKDGGGHTADYERNDNKLMTEAEKLVKSAHTYRR